MKKVFLISFLLIYYNLGFSHTTWLSIDDKAEQLSPEMVFKDNGASGLTIDYTFHGVLV